ncbi:glycosyltransferase family 2 protein [Calothrix sp. 336/3]|uniref:glycosyltransferase family 2 protein n=1 Tax=Calothrix sp. 336/3 TaxID=1337936 RepID=UPI0004E3492E|nr:glycosyltransferase family 2 protein [Calothrix sp. 336/3]AKG22982.1 glycosyl transferase family 2 [Calothrix sp. 336/3]
MPKVSICIPTFNRIHLLPLAIESVLQQTYQDFELLVCDDGSTDGTSEMMANYTDTRVKYICHGKNIGKSNNMRSGFDAASGDYFVKFDDDDKLTPEFLAETVAILDNHPDVDFVGTDHWIIDIDNIRNVEQTKNNSRKWKRTELSEGIVHNLLETVFVHQSFQIGATLFRRKALQELDFMRANWQNCEDNDLFVRLALGNKQGYFLPKLLMEYRCHPEQQTPDRAIRYLQDKIQYLQSYNFASAKLESIRCQRLAETQLLLGIRLIEKGDTEKGRQLTIAGKSTSYLKASIALTLSLLPLGMRRQLLGFLRTHQKS